MSAGDAPPPIEHLAVIGDRRAAAMLDEHASIVWLCLPWYNDPPILASLLDQEIGGEWRISCERAAVAQRTYAPREPIHRMRWQIDDDTCVELADFMPFPGDDRPDGLDDTRLVVRHIGCHGPGEASMSVSLGLAPGVGARCGTDGAALVERDSEDLGSLLASHPLQVSDTSVSSEFVLSGGEEAWFVLATGPQLDVDADTVREWLEETTGYWREWTETVDWPGGGKDQILDSACVLHLLSCAPAGAPVAAPTTSLPERIGGDRNYDYRYAWIRDASLTLAALSLLGKREAVQAYMDWICTLESATPAPLQVVYQFDGGTRIPERNVDAFSGYAGSRPVRYGNRAYEQSQLDSLGYFADCTLRYLEAGGQWEDHHWIKLEQSAAWTSASWREPDHGIWELPAKRHWTSSKVMSWTVLDRVIRIAALVDHQAPTDSWAASRDEIHAEVLARGFAEDRQSFRQHYDSSAVDGSLLLIPYMGFLPVDDARVVSTVNRIRADLEIDGMVYRFDPARTPGSESELPLGEYEAGFLVCTFWLASFLARSGDVAGAQKLLSDIERASPTGLFAEQMDGASRAHRGNTPLLFSHAEYLRARADIEACRDSHRLDGSTEGRPNHGDLPDQLEGARAAQP